jgi:hypothetical protein
MIDSDSQMLETTISNLNLLQGNNLETLIEKGLSKK